MLVFGHFVCRSPAAFSFLFSIVFFVLLFFFLFGLVVFFNFISLGEVFPCNFCLVSSVFFFYLSACGSMAVLSCESAILTKPTISLPSFNFLFRKSNSTSFDSSSVLIANWFFVLFICNSLLHTFLHCTHPRSFFLSFFLFEALFLFSLHPSFFYRPSSFLSFFLLQGFLSFFLSFFYRPSSFPYFPLFLGLLFYPFLSFIGFLSFFLSLWGLITSFFASSFLLQTFFLSFFLL